MKLLFAGSSRCSKRTFKRLLLLCDWLGFMDQPAVSFSNWGMVGSESWFRSMESAFQGQAVQLQVFGSPGGPAEGLYRECAMHDIACADFRSVFLQGLRSSREFSDKFVQYEADYGGRKGREVISALASDESLLSVPLTGLSMRNPRGMFEVDSGDSRADTLRTLLAEASVQITHAVVTSGEQGYAPVADDPYTARLLSMRMTGGPMGATPFETAGLLGLEIAQAVIPEEVLDRLTIKDVLDYRRQSREAFAAWSAELNTLSAEIEATSPSEVGRAIPAIVARRVAPRVEEYRSEMTSISERLFGDLVKAAVKWELPALTVAYAGPYEFWVKAAAIASGTALTVVPAFVDFVLARRAAARGNAVSYFVRLSRTR